MERFELFTNTFERLINIDQTIENKEYEVYNILSYFNTLLTKGVDDIRLLNIFVDFICKRLIKYFKSTVPKYYIMGILRFYPGAYELLKKPKITYVEWIKLFELNPSIYCYMPTKLKTRDISKTAISHTKDNISCVPTNQLINELQVDNLSSGECFICMNNSNKLVTLKCSHILCIKCINCICKNNEIKCPFCRSLEELEYVTRVI